MTLLLVLQCSYMLRYDAETEENQAKIFPKGRKDQNEPDLISAGHTGTIQNDYPGFGALEFEKVVYQWNLIGYLERPKPL